jgi:predicted transcriptional regulator
MTVRGRVTNGRLVVDEPTDPPEGSEVELSLVDEGLHDEERARLAAALAASEDDFRAGRVIPGDQVIARLRAGETFEVDEEQVAALRESIDEANRGELVPLDDVLRRR